MLVIYNKNKDKQTEKCWDKLEIKEVDGMFFLICYEKHTVADYCFFSLDEAIEQAYYMFNTKKEEWAEVPNLDNME